MTDSRPSTTLTINRALVGVIALVMLASGGVLWIFLGNQSMWTGACVKVGMVMATFWMALPSIGRDRSWGQVSIGTLATLLVLALVLMGKRVDFRIVLAVLFGAAIAITILRPRSKSGVKFK